MVNSAVLIAGRRPRFQVCAGRRRLLGGLRDGARGLAEPKGKWMDLADLLGWNMLEQIMNYP